MSMPLSFCKFRTSGVGIDMVDHMQQLCMGVMDVCVRTEQALLYMPFSCNTNESYQQCIFCARWLNKQKLCWHQIQPVSAFLLNSLDEVNRWKRYNQEHLDTEKTTPTIDIAASASASSRIIISQNVKHDTLERKGGAGERARRFISGCNLSCIFHAFRTKRQKKTADQT